VKEQHNIFMVTRVADADRLELASYQLKSVAKIWYDQLKKSMAERAPLVSCAIFESAFLRRFFPYEPREEKVREF